MPHTERPESEPDGAEPQGPERHGLAWSADEEKQLYDAFVAGQKIKDIAETHQRTTGGIRGCMRKLGLMDDEGNVVTPTPAFAPSAAAQKRAGKAAAKAERKKSAQPLTPENLSPEMNERFENAIHLMEDTDQNIFITGKAGTGKSTLLSYFCRTTTKQPVVLAPTGVAALNVRGQTIHSFFNFYVDVTPEKIRTQKKKPRNAKLYKKLKMIIIDEVSMVRADILDCIDAFLRLHGPRPARPFGGVQMIFVGDLYQLPPVVSSRDKDIFGTHYATPYFFSAHALEDSDLELVELDTVYRQKDMGFVELLNKIRTNSASAADIARINSRLIKSDTAPERSFHITLTTTNAIADNINDIHLRALKGKTYSSEARMEGNFGHEYYPTSVDLIFKVGAQIMMLNNDQEKRWVNGSLGVIEAVKHDDNGDEYLKVALQDSPKSVEVYPYSWEVYRFGVEDNAVTAEPIGAFTQYPFRLAWGITIHKSQGKTFERVTIDVGRGAFAAGQMYVALSRCTSFEGVSLKTLIRAQDIRTDPQILSFLAHYQDATEDVAEETDASAPDKKQLIQAAIAEKSALDITYRKADDTHIESRIIPLVIGTATYQGNPYEGMKAFCTDAQEERMYRVDRILKIRKAGR